MAFEYRRHPAVQRRIADIREDDVRVRLLGRVLGRENGTIILDDGTSTAEIVSDADATGVVRVFARVLPLENGYELRAELVQDMNRLDTELHRRVLA